MKLLVAEAMLEAVDDALLTPQTTLAALAVAMDPMFVTCVAASVATVL